MLRRAIHQAQVRDKVGRNVAKLVTTPKGREGRPSRALNLDQATRVLEEAQWSSLHAYVVVSLMTGIRTEEARELRWDHVVTRDNDDAPWQPVTEAGFEHQEFALYVWRSVRVDGDTKTEKSRRTLKLPAQAADALRTLHVRQATDRKTAAGHLAGPRPGVLHQGRHSPIGRKRAPILPHHHQSGRHRGQVDSS